MRWGQTVAIVAAVGLFGCGGDEEASYKLVRVSGIITKNGKPLSDAKVTFVPAQANKPSTSGVDVTGPEGNYLLNFKGRTGVAPGKYTVLIEPAEDTSGLKVREEFSKDPMQMKVAQQAKTIGKTEKDTRKKEVFKGEFEAEVPDAATFTRDFDVKASATGGSTAKG
jgi:hypothetical protein